MVILTTPDVNVRLIDFPGPGREMVVSNEDGSFTILINAKLTHESQEEAYRHAMRHIKAYDFQKTDVQAIEVNAHKEDSVQETTPVVKPAIPEKYAKRIRSLQKERQRLQRELVDYQQAMELLARVEPSRFGSVLEVVELPERWRD